MSNSRRRIKAIFEITAPIEANSHVWRVLTRSLVSRLVEVDPKKMKHEEKLAFWINVHNALVMHWLQSLFFPKAYCKFKDARKAYAIDHPKPRTYFALCSGRHSDPAVKSTDAGRKSCSTGQLSQNHEKLKNKVAAPKCDPSSAPPHITY